MAIRTVAKPTNAASSRNRRRLADYGGSNNWTAGSNDSFNLMHQVYRGKFDRLERYRMHEWMDQDSDISRALDLIAEHCSEKDTDGRYFQFEWHTNEPTVEISEILKAHVDQWSTINKMKKHLFKTIRNVLKYGDWFMFRNPNTFELYDIPPWDILGAIVDRNTLDILGWAVKDFRWNINDLEINVESDDIKQQLANFSRTSVGGDTTQYNRIIPAVHILQFSMSEGKLASSGMNGTGTGQYTNPWPFGNSWLDKAYKTFKQRELLEDAALIHRTQRAPSRHVWYIDTGKMRHDRSKFVVENFKNELNQKRIPQFTSNNSNSVDSIYNPISQLEDYYIPVSMDQRGSKVEQLEGTPWTDLPDLDYFKKKMASALRVPYAWLQPAGEGGITPADGRMGQATQEEIEFSRFCTRVQTYLVDSFDHEFKLYAKWRDVSVNWADFELAFNPPTDYQASKDRARLNEAMAAFKTMIEIPWISKRLAMKEALGWTDDKIAMNEKMVDEETNRTEASQDMDMLGGGAGIPMDDLPFGDNGLEAATDAPIGGDQVVGGGDMGGDVGGMEMGMESFNFALGDDGDFLFEEELEMPKPKTDMTDVGRTPDDNSIGGDDPIKGQPLVTLDMLQRLRHAHFSKRVDWQKRLKMLNRIYSPPSSDGGAPSMGGF